MKACQGLGILKPFSRHLSVKTLEQVYKMYIRPHLKYLMNTLERIQYHCALAITGTWKGTSVNKIYDELGWESLNDRRYCRRLLQFYKIRNTK